MELTANIHSGKFHNFCSLYILRTKESVPVETFRIFALRYIKFRVLRFYVNRLGHFSFIVGVVLVYNLHVFHGYLLMVGNEGMLYDVQVFIPITMIFYPFL